MDDRGCTGSGGGAATEQARAAAGRCSPRPLPRAHARLELAQRCAAAGEQARSGLSAMLRPGCAQCEHSAQS